MKAKVQKKSDPRMCIIIVPDQEEAVHPTLRDAVAGQVVYVLHSDNNPEGYMLVMQDPNGHMREATEDDAEEVAVVTLDGSATILSYDADTCVRYVESRLVINE